MVLLVKKESQACAKANKPLNFFDGGPFASFSAVALSDDMLGWSFFSRTCNKSWLWLI